MTDDRWFEVEVRVKRDRLVRRMTVRGTLMPRTGLAVIHDATLTGDEWVLPPAALAEAVDEQADAIAAQIVGPRGGHYRVLRIEPSREWNADQTGLSLGEVLFGSALEDGGTAEQVIVPVRILGRYVRPAKP